MINRNSQPGRKGRVSPLGGFWLLPSEWMQLAVRSTQPARDLVEQCFTLSGRLFPAWIEYQRLWDRWLRNALGVQWPFGASEVSQAMMGPWGPWLRAAETSESRSSMAPLAKGLEDVRREVAALRQELERHQARGGES